MKITTTFFAAALGLMVAAAPALARGPGGHGGWGEGGCSDRDTPLTTTQVKDIIEGKIAWKGENLKVGQVTETAPGTIVAEVLNQDGTVARKVQVDAATGRFRRAQ